LGSSLSDLSVGCLVVHCRLGCLMVVLARREVSKDAELLVLRHAAGGFLEARDYPHGGAP
jgi:hypothetical protein